MKYIYRLNKDQLFNSCCLYDENDQLVYTLKQKVLALGERYRYYDCNDNEVGLIKQSFFHGFEIYNYGVKVAELKRLVGFSFKKRFQLMDYGWIIESNFWGNKYFVRDSNNNLIMDVWVKFLALPDLIEVNVYDNENTFVCLLCAMALTFFKNSSND